MDGQRDRRPDGAPPQDAPTCLCERSPAEPCCRRRPQACLPPCPVLYAAPAPSRQLFLCVSCALAAPGSGTGARVVSGLRNTASSVATQQSPHRAGSAGVTRLRHLGNGQKEVIEPKIKKNLQFILWRPSLCGRQRAAACRAPREPGCSLSTGIRGPAAFWHGSFASQLLQLALVKRLRTALRGVWRNSVEMLLAATSCSGCPCCSFQAAPQIKGSVPVLKG